MRECIAMHLAMGAIWLMTGYLARLAEVYLDLGRYEEGLDAIMEAFTLMEETGERHYEAELHRIKGELLLHKHREGMPANSEQAVDEAEMSLQRALNVSRRQEAKALELRAAMSLSRLWHQNGKSQQAHQLLSGIYDWFTEGFDTADLQDAKALLGELAER